MQETHSKYVVPPSFFVPLGVLVPVPPNCPLDANSLLVVDIGVFARDAAIWPDAEASLLPPAAPGVCTRCRHVVSTKLIQNTVRVSY